MADYSLLEKVKIIFTTILSTPLFAISTLLGLFLIILMIVCIIKKKKISKWIYVSGWVCVLLFIALKYTKLVPTLLDNLVDTFIKSLYFPSLGVYVSIVLISNIIFIILNFQKNIRKSYKITSLITAIILNVLFIIIAGFVTKHKIDISAEINLYTASTLLVLLQISMFIFVLYILIILFMRLYYKLKLLDEIKFGDDYNYPEMPQFTLPVIAHTKDKIFVRRIFKFKNNTDFQLRKSIKK